MMRGLVALALCAQVRGLASLARLRTVPLQTIEVATGEQAPPLVIIHGLFGSARNFLGFSTLLSKKLERPRRIIMVDLRNHGKSPHSDTMSYEEMAADVLALLTERGIERCAVIGHSMGGKVAMVLALNRPELFESLAVLDIAPVTYTSSNNAAWAEVVSIVDACAELPLEQLEDRNHASELLEPAVPNAVMRSFVLTNMDGSPSAGWHWRINVPAIRDAMREIESFPYEPDGSVQYPRQSFFIAGGKSTFLKSSHLPAIASFCPTFTIAKIKDAGHWVHTEDTDATLRLVREFLDGDHS